MFDSITVKAADHVIGEAEGVITNWIDDPEKGCYGFIEVDDVGTVFIHDSVVTDFDPNTVFLPGDSLAFKYEGVPGKNGEMRRRATKVLSFSEKGLCTGTVTRIHSKGFAFIKADPQCDLLQFVWVAPKLVKWHELVSGQRVQFACVSRDKGLRCTYLSSEIVDDDRAALREDRRRRHGTQLRFGSAAERCGPPAEVKARKAKRAAEEQARRAAVRGSNAGGVGKPALNPKKQEKRRRKLAQRKRK